MLDTETVSTSKERYLTRRWNNTLTAALGIPALAFAVVALGTAALSDTAAFAWMVGIGAVY